MDTPTLVCVRLVLIYEKWTWGLNLRIINLDISLAIPLTNPAVVFVGLQDIFSMELSGSEDWNTLEH